MRSQKGTGDKTYTRRIEIILSRMEMAVNALLLRMESEEGFSSIVKDSAPQLLKILQLVEKIDEMIVIQQERDQRYEEENFRVDIGIIKKYLSNLS